MLDGQLWWKGHLVLAAVLAPSAVLFEVVHAKIVGCSTQASRLKHNGRLRFWCLQTMNANHVQLSLTEVLFQVW